MIDENKFKNLKSQTQDGLIIQAQRTDGSFKIIEPSNDGLWLKANGGDFGPIAQYVPPPPPPVVIPPLTRRQVFIGMADAGLITAPEAIAAAAIGTPPAAVEAAFLLMPPAQQTPARITFAAFQTAYREDPMTALLQATAGMTAAQMDAFFTTYAAI